jgi:amidase
MNPESTATSLASPEAEQSAGVGRILLEVRDVRSGYGRVPVLHGVSFQLAEGEALGIVGHNGMGKTTLLKTLMGLLPATGGHITLDGTEVTREPAHARSRRAAYAADEASCRVFPRWIISAWRGPAIRTSRSRRRRPLRGPVPASAPLLDRRGGTLSGGEQQMLAWRACAQPVDHSLDEPSEGVQPSIVNEIGKILSRLKAEAKLAIVIVEQNLDLVLDVATRIAVLERGRIARQFGPEEVGAGSALVDALGLGSVRMTRGSQAPARQTPARPLPLQRAAPNEPASQQSSAVVPSVRPLPSAALAEPPATSASSTRVTAGAAAPRAEVSMSNVKRPTLAQMKDIVTSLHMSMSDREIGEYLDVMEATFQAYDRLQQLPDHLPPVRYPRTPGYRPGASENPLNAWAVKSEVRGAPYGPLAGKRVVLKDNVCLAGVPMMNGASTLEGYVPDVDATIVTRILDAGGTILGKAHCEYFCLSGGSHTSALGPVHNPYKYGYSAGGSSSGSGALVGAGEVEMAIGGDQGGSIRMPACWSGCYGMKPTHGLVPYTGVMPIEATIDHTGPMTATVADNALLLEVIAGADGLDPRQYDVRVDKYTAALGRGVAGLRIGVLSEGFGHAVSETDVDQKVRQGADRLRALGAAVEDVSIPMHLDGPAIWTAIALEGLEMQMMHGNGMGFNWKGLYTTSLLDAHANWRARANELSRTLKISMMIGEYFVRHYRGHFYAKAQNLGRLLRQTYDETLNRYDLLLMPTLPMKATPIPEQNAPLALYCQRGFEMLPNTCPFDVTGHPAMSIPCGMSQGLRSAAVGKTYNESI